MYRGGRLHSYTWAALALSLAACSTSPSALRVRSATPNILCVAEEPGVVSVEGTGFAAVLTGGLTDAAGMARPSAELVPVSGLAEGSPPPDVSSVALPDLRWRSATALDLTLGRGVPPATYDLVVTGVDGASDAVAVAVAGRPRVDDAIPRKICQAASGVVVRLHGTGFLVLNGEGPTVSIGSVALPTAPAECEPLAVDPESSVCTALDVTVDGTVYPAGALELAVRNPSPAGCAASAPTSLVVTPPPTLVSVTPEAVCVADGAWVTVSGSGLTEGAQVTVGGVPAAAVEHVDDRTLRVELDPATPIGPADVVVQVPSGCGATLPAGVDVAPPPLVWGVTPSAVYAPIGAEVVVWVSGLVAPVSEVMLEGPDGAVVVVDWSWDADAGGRIDVTVPGGLASGLWTVAVSDDTGCGAAFGGLTVVDTPTLALEAVEPGQAWAFDRTPMVLTATDPPPVGQVGFADGLRVDLIGPAPLTASVPVLAAEMDSSARARATVPEGLAVGQYGVLVTQPDGSLGWLPDAVTVSFVPPPTIDSARPGTFPNDDDAPIRILGRDFQQPSVELDCDDGTSWDAPVDSWDFGEILAVVPARSIDRGVCTVTVINEDGARATWSAFSVTNPAQNLYDWEAAPELEQGRRAPIAAAARIDAVSRRVWAIGGDRGTPEEALSTVEVAQVGVYGDLGPWATLPIELPGPLTLSGGAVIGRFVYLLGGHDGVGPVADVSRAIALDPVEAPSITDVEVADGGGDGLTAGRWRYRVAALQSPADPTNPGGEGLASAATVLTLPDLPGRLQPTLRWTPIAGAVGYRVFRSPEADAPSGTECQVADVVATRFTDVGAPGACGVMPIPVGSLGAWAALPPLPEPRESACVAVIADPATDPEVRYIFVAGGQRDDGVLLDTLLRLRVEVLSATRQDVGVWEEVEVRLPGGRVRCGAFAVDARLHTVVARDEAWLYVGGGAGERGAEGDVWAGRVESGGRVVDWQSVDSLRPARAGFAAASASDFLYAFGGQNDRASAGGVSGRIDGSALPEILSFNSLGISWEEARWLPGLAQESAVLITVGGATDDAPASATVEVTSY
ncbi:MAG: hypothetical protein ACI9K2_007003 [Myxococcota bacterium]